MDRFIKSIILALLAFFLVAILFYSDKSNASSKTIIRPAIDTKVYKIWAKVNGEEFCKSQDLNSNKSPYDILGKLVDSKVDIVYLIGVDIMTCGNYIQEISTKLHNYGLLLAMDIDLNIDIKQVFGENYSTFKPEYFSNRISATKDATNWVSYFVFNDSENQFTFNERRQIQSKLREVYTNSFIGFRFENNIRPTPENTHPKRNVSWNEFMPSEDDGDFIITSIPVAGFKRTQVFTDGIDLNTADGQLLTIKA